MSAVDVEGLFKQFTVKEIREIEKRAKGDVEQKKEDLRQMVGRRYRDIIDAADTIRDMTFISEAIVKSIREVQASCDKLQGLHSHMIVNQQQHNSQSKSSSVSDTSCLDAQIKLFSDISELIYESLEDGDYARVLDAAYIYNLGEHLYHRLCLHLPAEENGAPSKKRILLDQMWPAVKQLRKVILQDSKNILSSWKIISDQTEGVEAIKHAVGAILLLETSTVNETLKVVLKCRQEAIGQCFLSDVSSREQICICLSILQHTLLNVQSLFTPNSHNSNSALVQLINQVLQAKWSSGVFTSYLNCQVRLFSSYLPPEIRNFTLRLSSTIMDIDKDSLENFVSSWLKDCLDVCRSESKTRLGYCESIDALTSLKKSILATIENENVSDSWRSACMQIVGEELSLWQISLSDVVKARLQDISTEVIRSGFDELKNSLEQQDLQYSCDLAVFVWHKELNSDVPAVVSTTSLSTLPMKARGIAPHIFQLIDRLNKHLESLHSGIDEHMKLGTVVDTVMEDTVYSTLGSCLLLHVENLTQWMTETLKAISLKEDDKITKNKLDTCVRLSQTCSCLCELCPQLKLILSWQTQDSRDRLRRGHETDNWLKARTALHDSSVAALKLWLEEKVELATVDAGWVELKQVNDVNWLEQMTDWEAIDMQEETDEGKKVNSQLHLPRQSSKFVHQFLMEINRGLSSIAAYRIPKKAHQYVVVLTCSKILQFIDDFVKKQAESQSALAQRIAVQLLFDLKFASAILVSKMKEDANLDKAVQLGREVELLIDPFDLDLLAPHIKKNINKLVGKSLTLYGALILPETAASLTRSVGGKSSTTADPAQMLPLATAVPRFQLLPISATHIEYSSLDVKPLMPLHNISTPNLQSLKDKTTSNSQKLSTVTLSSMYDKISTSWFGM